MGLKIAHQGIMIIPLTTNKHKPRHSSRTHAPRQLHYYCYIVDSPSLLLLVVVVVVAVAGDDLGGDVVVVRLDVHVCPRLALPLLQQAALGRGHEAVGCGLAPHLTCSGVMLRLGTVNIKPILQFK